MPTANQYDVVIVGGGAAGIATASSILRRAPNLSVAIVEPADQHYYQPGWTMVGAWCFFSAYNRQIHGISDPKIGHLGTGRCDYARS
jgi:sulfide:quinone oxidoreductase